MFLRSSQPPTPQHSGRQTLHRRDKSPCLHPVSLLRLPRNGKKAGQFYTIQDHIKPTAPLFELQKAFKVLTNDLWPRFCGLPEKEDAFSC